MSSDVKVSGIPSHIKLGKLIPLFSDILSMRSGDFLMRILSTKGPVNDILLSLPTHLDAQLAQEKLDNFVYKHDKITYVFTAEMHGGYNQYLNKANSKSRFTNQKRQSYSHRYEDEYRRERSRSPHYENKFSQLNMQLEIVKKQRMILEEERKLLEEQKKLEELKMRSFNSQSSSFTRICDEDVEGCELSSNYSIKKSRQPNYHQASKVLLEKMRMFISMHSSFEERKALLMHLQSIIEQRLAMVVAQDGRDISQTRKVIMLYRSQYPPSEDEELVKQVLEDVRGQKNDTEIVQASAKGANTKSKRDVTESAAGNSNVSKIDKDKAHEKVEKKFDEKRLFFFKSSGALIKSMNDIIKEFSSPETHKILVEYLRFTLRQRLAAVVAGQPIYQTNKIINMYRDRYPPEDDENLMKQLLKDIEEDRVPEDVMNKNKQKKIDLATDEQNNSSVDNKTLQDKMFADEEVIDISGEPERKEGTDVSGNTDNRKNVEDNIVGKMIQVYEIEENDENKAECPSKEDPEKSNAHEINDDKDIQKNEEINVECTLSVDPEVANANKIDDNVEINKNEENKAESTLSVNPEVTNANKSIDNIENTMSSDLVSEKTEKIATISNLSDDNTTDISIKTDVVATEVTNKDSNNKNVNVESHGVKRKNDGDEDNCIKVAKTDDVAVISRENGNTF